MSANLDLVRSIFADWERGDFGRADWAHSDIEYVWADGPSPFSTTGVAGMAETWRSWLSAWENVRIGVDEYRDLDGERVLVLSHYSGGSGKTSGLDLGQMQTKVASLLEVRDGKVKRIVLYGERDRAFADLGLTPEGDEA